MARVQHPQPQVGVITDRIGGIEFTDGVAEVDLSDKPNLREAFVQHGYRVETLIEHKVYGGGIHIDLPGDASTVVEPIESADVSVYPLPLPLPKAAEGTGTPSVYEFAEPESTTEAYIPPRRTRKA